MSLNSLVGITSRYRSILKYKKHLRVFFIGLAFNGAALCQDLVLRGEVK